MSKHDSLCPLRMDGLHDGPQSPYYECPCDLITRVREDEGKSWQGTVENLLDRAERAEAAVEQARAEGYGAAWVDESSTYREHYAAGRADAAAAVAALPTGSTPGWIEQTEAVAAARGQEAGE